LVSWGWGRTTRRRPPRTENRRTSTGSASSCAWGTSATWNPPPTRTTVGGLVRGCQPPFYSAANPPCTASMIRTHKASSFLRLGFFGSFVLVLSSRTSASMRSPHSTILS